ncbi:RNA polymerase sigma E factor [Gammaproteobacteria bacterium]
MAGEDPDRALVCRAQQGDRQAFDLLVLKYQQRVVHLAARYIKCREGAQDVAQEAFIKAYRSLTTFHGDSAFYTWLYRIVINTAKNHLTAEVRRFVSTGVDVATAEQWEGNSRLHDLDTPERLVLAGEIRDRITQALEALPEDLRTAIVLRELEGMSYEAIAVAMSCPVGTVRSRIFRARDAIDRCLKPLLHHDEP